MISELARYYKGAYQIIDMMKKTFRDILFWYRLHEREIIEESIISKLKDKPMPSRKRLKRMVDKEIEKRKAEVLL